MIDTLSTMEEKKLILAVADNPVFNNPTLEGYHDQYLKSTRFLSFILANFSKINRDLMFVTKESGSARSCFFATSQTVSALEMSCGSFLKMRFWVRPVQKTHLVDTSPA